MPMPPRPGRGRERVASEVSDLAHVAPYPANAERAFAHVAQGGGEGQHVCFNAGRAHPLDKGSVFGQQNKGRDAQAIQRVEHPNQRDLAA